MLAVSTTDFFTHSYESRRAELARWLRRWRLGACWLLLALCGSLPPAFAAQAAQAVQTKDAEADELRLERADDGLYLAANLQFELPEPVEEALYKGIAMFFVAEAQVLRERWYWSDRLLAETRRYFRLSYQPLTHRWRLNVAPAPFNNDGLGVLLGQNFDDYADALSAMQRFARWKIAEPGAIDARAAHWVHLRFRLDIAQLPRPLQIGAAGRADWNLLLARSQRLAAEAAP